MHVGNTAAAVLRRFRIMPISEDEIRGSIYVSSHFRVKEAVITYRIFAERGD